MGRLFYTDKTESRTLDYVSNHFILEYFIPNVGMFLRSDTPTISTFFEPHVSSAKEMKELSKDLAISARSVALKTGNSITVSIYLSKRPDAFGAIKIKPLIVISTSCDRLSNLLLKAGESHAAAAAEAAIETIKGIQKTCGERILMAPNEESTLFLARAAILAFQGKPHKDETLLGACFGDIDLAPYQKCIFARGMVGTLYSRNTYPEVSIAESAEDLFGIFVSEELPPGVGCKIECYAVSANSMSSQLPQASIPHSLESDGTSEALSSAYVHWEDKSVVWPHFGTFMEHMAVRNLELGVLKTLAKTSKSMWGAMDEHSGVAFMNYFPGSIAFFNKTLGQKIAKLILE